ncbi:MAG: pyridoxine 5-phosphate synthase [Bacteroidota bacterium]|jgi:pyridoxine 5-phosphate synthase
MFRLSVNINKIALIRNARGGNLPDLLQVARDCEDFGAQGITVHPRPDQRHIRYDDIPALRAVVRTEFNIEGNPEPDFMALVCANPPHQCTLVPDSQDQRTSDHGWDTVAHGSFLREITAALQEKGIRVSIFVDPDPRMIAGAKAVGADRVELYTGPYAAEFPQDPAAAIAPYARAAEEAGRLGIGLNAGHDLNLANLHYFKRHCPQLLEVSIGHALICDALYYGLSNTIRMYLRQLSEA